MTAEIKTGMEEIEATKSAANEEKIQVIAEPYKWAQRLKAIHMLTVLQARASDVLQGIPKQEMY
jgi:hypothetical protein